MRKQKRKKFTSKANQVVIAPKFKVGQIVEYGESGTPCYFKISEIVARVIFKEGSNTLTEICYYRDAKSFQTQNAVMEASILRVVAES